MMHTEREKFIYVCSSTGSKDKANRLKPETTCVASTQTKDKANHLESNLSHGCVEVSVKNAYTNRDIPT